MTTRASIYPADQLLAWLEQQKPDLGEILLRLPVLVTLKPSKMNIKPGTVGDKPDALVIKVNDLSLGVPIAGRMPELCEGKESCMLWLRGVWRGGEIKEFQVSKIEGLIAEADQAAANYVEIVK